MTSALKVPRRAMMLLAKPTAPLFAVAKASFAAGAISWISCSIARPSSVPSGESSSTVTTGKSPLPTSPAAWVEQVAQVSKLSDSAPMRIPVPSNPAAWAMSAFSSATAWLCTLPALCRGRCTAWIDCTAGNKVAERAWPSGRKPSRCDGSTALTAVRRKPAAFSAGSA
jgi:hypothetical protein